MRPILPEKIWESSLLIIISKQTENNNRKFRRYDYFFKTIKLKVMKAISY